MESSIYYFVSAEDLCAQITRDIGEAKGIYKLRCVSSDGRSYIPIQRLLAVDLGGVIYIGKSGKSLMERVAKVRKSLCAAAGNQRFTDIGCHPCGHKYKPEAIQKLLPFEHLCITVHPVESNEPDAADRMEVEHLRDYERQFGEMPPFNDGRPIARWLHREWYPASK